MESVQLSGIKGRALIGLVWVTNTSLNHSLWPWERHRMVKDHCEWEGRHIIESNGKEGSLSTKERNNSLDK